MVVVVVIVVVVVVVIVVVDLQERRLDVEDAIEIEGATLQHVGDGDVAALGAVQRRVGVDAADSRLDLAQLGRR